MGLSKYNQKRSFDQTPEPRGGRAQAGKLQFVIQKHAASHLHYDFRLEMEGVLKSWAVPKGPSTDPSVKRLAMMVEDHPYDYKDFEGVIPTGNYGAGTVIVWDRGSYEAVGIQSNNKKDHEKALLKQLKNGSLKIVLHGKKLKGEYALVKTKGYSENGWLLIKHRDSYASDTDITKKDKSVISKKTLEQVARTSDKIWESNKAVSAKKKTRKADEESAPEKAGEKKVKTKKTVRKKTTTKTATPASTKKNAGNSQPKKTGRTKKITTEAEGILDSATKKTFPASLKPMLATLVDRAFDEEGWLYEVKWDGYRALALSNKGKVRLKSRNDKSFDDKFYPVHAAVKDLGLNVILDGEIVVVKETGISNFGALQNWRSEADGQLLFYVFDILWYEGKDLTKIPLIDRKTLLKELIPENETIRISDTFDEPGTSFFETAKKMGLEGIIAKKADSIYHEGIRTHDWLKIKSNKRQEVVIGGYTRNDDTSKLFSALLVGVYEKDKLVYTGKIGTGFNHKTQQEMMKLFKPLLAKKPPFSETPDVNKPSRFRPNPPHATAYWLKPKLVCEVSYTELTSDGIMRHPSFEGMRMDKKPQDIGIETEKSTKKIVKAKKSTSASKRKQGTKTKVSSKAKPGKEKTIVKPVAAKQKTTLLNPSEETQVKKVNGHELKFTNLSKIYWPKEKYTKRDLINYYYQVAQYILPYLKDRPQSMNRYPDGINGESFYYKDITGKAPTWIKTYKYVSDTDNRERHYLVATDEASLLYMAGLGCIEMNPWSSTIKKPNHPDFCMIDLDPGKKTKFDEVIETARVTKAVLDGLGIDSYCKTSGSTGLHIYIPFGKKYTFDQSKEFARIIAQLVSQELPKITTIERTVDKRKGRLYIDFLQNRPHATIACAYSVRPKPGATVSMPLHWDEVRKGLKMTDFTILNALDRIRSEGDIFKPVLGKGIDLKKVVKSLEV